MTVHTSTCQWQNGQCIQHPVSKTTVSYGPCRHCGQVVAYEWVGAYWLHVQTRALWCARPGGTRAEPKR